MLNQYLDKIMSGWKWIQEFLDVQGDAVMLGWTAVVVYKVFTVGLNPSDAAAYATAVGVFGYSKGKKQ